MEERGFVVGDCEEKQEKPILLQRRLALLQKAGEIVAEIEKVSDRRERYLLRRMVDMLLNDL